MITLQKLLTTDVDASAPAQTGKTADSAQDFLALLAGALGENAATATGEAPLSLADLQDASGKALKNLRALAADDAQTPAQKLADLLARQTGESDTAPGLNSTPLQTLLSGLTPLTPEIKNGMLAALDKQDTHDETSTESEALAGLSALMAMLPHQQAAQLAPGNAAPAASSVAGAAGAATRAQTPHDIASLTPAAAQKTDAMTPALTDAQSAPFISQLAARQDSDNAAQTVNTTLSAAPVISNASAAQASAPVAAAAISAPLGSQEWQQSLSQHVTLFTRQGQQSAELHLHPEDLGQVQISLKIDDNMAQLQMVSPHSHVRQALEAALPVLRNSLAESGIQLGQSNISSESFAGQQNASSQQQHASRSGGNGQNSRDDDEPLLAPASLQSLSRGEGAVDIFA